MKDHDVRELFKERLNHLLETSRTSQKELAQKLGVSTSTVSSWVLGDKMPRVDKLDAIAAYFSVKRSDLLVNKVEIGTPYNPTKRIPVLGKISAGSPLYCEENIQPEYRIFNYTKYYLNHEMQRGCKLSGAKKIRVHDLRHSHASLLIQMGFSPLLISERLGHESVETTLNTYSHLYPNAHEDLANQLDNLGTNKKFLKNGTLTVLR